MDNIVERAFKNKKLDVVGEMDPAIFSIPAQKKKKRKRNAYHKQLRNASRGFRFIG